MKSICLATCAIVLSAAYGFAGDKDGKGGGTVSDFQDAYNIATQDPPTGQLLNSRIEQKQDGTVVYGFYLYNRNQRLLFEREVDLKSRKVVKDTSRTLEKVQKDMLDLIEKKSTGKSKLPEGRLMEIAGEKLKNKEIKEMRYEKIGDQLVLSFGDMKIDASTGKEITK